MSKDAIVFEAYTALRRHPDWRDKRDCLLHREIAATLGYASADVVRGMVRRERDRRKQQAAPMLTVVARAPKQTDADRWRDAQRDLEGRRFVTVAHLSDGHRPYQDDDALALTYQRLEYIKPDLIVDLSDGFDFPEISHFTRDPDLSNADILDTVRPLWWAHNDELDRAAPQAYRRAIGGNHDLRLWSFLAESAPQVRSTVLNAFDEVVRAEGRVMFPDHMGEVHVGCVTVMHGDKSTLGVYGARKQLESRKYQRFIMAGHSHNPGWHHTRGIEYAVSSVVGGCLCDLNPHYLRNTSYSTWTQGFAYAVIDMQARHAWLQQVTLERHNGLLKTAIGSRIFAQEIVTATAANSASAAA